MATRASNKLTEHKVNVNGMEITVQLTEDEAEQMQATKGRAKVDTVPTVASVVKGDLDNGRDENPFDPSSVDGSAKPANRK